MSWLGSILGNTGTFDKLRQGRWDLKSNCGWVEECQKTKNCITRICSPNEEQFGGLFFDNCINYCNADYRAANVSEVLCQNPEGAYINYGYVCEGFDPKTTESGYIKIGDYSIKTTHLIIALISAVILFIILTRF